jgi:hypothetical protein
VPGTHGSAEGYRTGDEAANHRYSSCCAKVLPQIIKGGETPNIFDNYFKQTKLYAIKLYEEKE